MLKSHMAICLISFVAVASCLAKQEVKSVPFDMTLNLPLPNTELFNGYRVCTDGLFRDLVKNYPLESYKVVTEDGYILRLFRLQAKGTQITNGKPAVIIQHGVFDSSDNFVANHDDHSISFYLANRGYDVWVSNSRGNKYSRAHATLKPSQKEFWDFSFQEMGDYDIKANIDFILRQTGQSKVTYIGHSQGTTQMFAGLTSRASAYLNSKVKKFIALAPVVLPRSCSSPIISQLAADPFLAKALTTLGVTEVLGGGCSRMDPIKWATSQMCKMATSACQLLMSLTDGSPWYNNGALMSTLPYHFPSGSSTRSLIHYQQLMNLKDNGNPKFQMYDYGLVRNMQVYNSQTPPVFDFGKIKIPVSLHVGMQDKLGTVADNNILAQQLKAKGVNTKMYTYDNCGHATFVWAKDASKIFSDVLAELRS